MKFNIPLLKPVHGPSANLNSRAGFWEKTWDWRYALFIFAFLTMVMFGDVLFSNEGRILSARGLDLSACELSALDFQVQELKQGHLALWNPHIFSGTPNLYTPLYPPHLLNLFLSLDRAINLEIALHVFLLGFFTYLWTSYRRLHPLACLLCGVTAMFSGPYFMHLYAGHLGNLGAMAWVPLILLAMEGIIALPTARWVLLGIIAVTMQILSGQFQYVYYTAIVVAIYSVFRIYKRDRKQILLVIGGLLALVLGSLALSAFFLLPGLAAAGETMRSGGVSIAFASMFSFPPENIMTLIAPFFFGDITGFPYWGRCYLWEMSLFIGVTGIVLAVCGAFLGEKERRQFSLIMFMTLLILAMGVHTPLFYLLYEWLPGFKMFRGTSKFAFFAVMFLIMLEGIGLDYLLRRHSLPKKTSLILLWTALGIGCASVLLYMLPLGVNRQSGLWASIFSFVVATGESHLPMTFYNNPRFIEDAGRFSAAALSVTSGSFLILAFLVASLRKNPRSVYLLVVLAFLEVFLFARLNRPTLPYSATLIPFFEQFMKAHPGDYRVLSHVNPNSAMSTGARDIWGYNPVVLSRYGRFMAFAQNVDPDQATTSLPINSYHRLFSMLRLKYEFIATEKGIVIKEFNDVMSRVQLISAYKIGSTRDNIFRAMGNATFDPRKTVILEKMPDIESATTIARGICEVINESVHGITIKANLSVPAILLITENYSPGWKTTSLRAGIQRTYEIMPANYTLMAIPLSAGEHLFKLEYMPRAFTLGKWLSSISLIIIMCLLRYLFLRDKTHLATKKPIGNELNL
jgi:hypothetical protein